MFKPDIYLIPGCRSEGFLFPQAQGFVFIYKSLTIEHLAWELPYRYDEAWKKSLGV